MYVAVIISLQFELGKCKGIAQKIEVLCEAGYFGHAVAKITKRTCKPYFVFILHKAI